MHTRVVGLMQSWRGRGRQASRDALVRLAAAWKAADSAGPGTDGRDGSDGALNGADGPGTARPEQAGTEQAGTEQAGTEQAGTEQASTEQASTEQAGTEQASTEQAVQNMPERAENAAEPNRVPGWLQTGAAWSWRLLLLA